MPLHPNPFSGGISITSPLFCTPPPHFGGITLRSGRRALAVYRDGKVVAQYTAIGWRL